MTTTSPPILPVILSGGTGTRLWPLSRESYPKQFWPLASDKTMLAETAARGTGEGFLPPMVVCNEAHRFLVAEQLRDKGAAIVLEPVGRNSAPAIAAAALIAEETAPGAVLWFMAADAAIGDVAALQAALAKAAAAAQAGAIVTFGMQPSAPETGYGYIEAGDALPGSDGVQRIARFVEKPDAARAAEFLKTGRHLWNSGMFVATAATMLAELEAHAPDVLKGVRAAVAGAARRHCLAAHRQFQYSHSRSRARFPRRAMRRRRWRVHYCGRWVPTRWKRPCRAIARPPGSDALHCRRPSAAGSPRQNPARQFPPAWFCLKPAARIAWGSFRATEAKAWCRCRRTGSRAGSGGKRRSWAIIAPHRLAIRGKSGQSQGKGGLAFP